MSTKRSHGIFGLFFLLVIQYTHGECPSGWLNGKCTSSCFYVSEESYNVTDANQYCEDHGGHLLEDWKALPMDIQDYLIFLMNESNHYWIGHSGDRCQFLFVPKTSWIVAGFKNCALIKRFICRKDLCSKEWVLGYSSCDCLYFSTNQTDFYGAQAACAERNSQILTESDDLKILNEKVIAGKAEDQVKYWIGGYGHNDSYWSWIDNSPVDLAITDKEDCGLTLFKVSGFLRYDGENCTDNKPYICRKDPLAVDQPTEINNGCSQSEVPCVMMITILAVFCRKYFMGDL